MESAPTGGRAKPRPPAGCWRAARGSAGWGIPPYGRPGWLRASRLVGRLPRFVGEGHGPPAGACAAAGSPGPIWNRPLQAAGQSPRPSAGVGRQRGVRRDEGIPPYDRPGGCGHPLGPGVSPGSRGAAVHAPARWSQAQRASMPALHNSIRRGPRGSSRTTQRHRPAKNSPVTAKYVRRDAALPRGVRAAAAALPPPHQQVEHHLAKVVGAEQRGHRHAVQRREGIVLHAAGKKHRPQVERGRNSGQRRVGQKALHRKAGGFDQQAAPLPAARVATQAHRQNDRQRHAHQKQQNARARAPPPAATARPQAPKRG